MRKLILAASVSLFMTACASTTGESTGAAYDPLEGFNRQVYGFNEAVDKAALEPVARGYRAVTNEPVRGGVSNFLTNLRQPVVFANSVLQGKPEAALDTVARFMLNTTVGIGGIFDPATSIDVPEHDEDFGQTLGVWGVGTGPYLMLPILGPSTLRDTVGRGADNAFDPLTWTEFEDPDLDDQIQVGRTVVAAISTREALIEQIERLREQPEPYVALRRNYLAQRRAAIRDGEIEDDPYANLPDFGDFDDGAEEPESP